MVDRLKKRLNADRERHLATTDNSIIRLLNERWSKEGQSVGQFVEEYSTALDKLGRRIIIDITANPPIRRVK